MPARRMSSTRRRFSRSCPQATPPPGWSGPRRPMGPSWPATPA